MHRVFVYGTLKRGGVNHAYLRGQIWVGEAQTAPCYRMFDLGGYPGMVKATSDGLSIQGEVWDIDDRCLAELDLLEDIEGGEYLRTEVVLEPPLGGDSVQGYLYLRPTRSLRDAGARW